MCDRIDEIMDEIISAAECKVGDVIKAAYGYDSKWMFMLTASGNILGPVSSGTHLYCKSHGASGVCINCYVVFSISGWSWRDIPQLVDTVESIDDESGEVTFDERPGYLYDTYTNEWIKDNVDNMMAYVDEWIISGRENVGSCAAELRSILAKRHTS